MRRTDELGAGPSRRRLRLFGVLLLALCVGVGLAAGDVAAKKKKKHKASVFSASVAPNVAIPDKPPGTALETPAVSTITVGKKFKGKTVGDVNVTGITTAGDSPNSAGDLNFSLSAPSGKTVLLDSNSLGGQSIGPLTLDDDTPRSVCDDTTLTCSDPDATLLRPFIGTANLIGLRNGDLGPLNIFNGVAMRGTWTFRIWDTGTGQTSTLNSWGLQITPEKPVT
jgi:subtilisin-like proprotein convertase family protein